MTLRTLSRCLAASGLLAAATVAPAMAGSEAALQVSVQVVRSCRVTSDQPQVQVDCGSSPQVVHVTYDQAPLVLPSVGAPASAAPTTARTVTIHF